MKPIRTCATCKREKPAGAFPTTTARRCTRCRNARERAVCQRCGEPAGLTNRRQPRMFCAACHPIVRAEKLRELGDERAAATLARTEKRCPACAETKPLTGEFWARGSGPNPSDMWDGYCRSCRSALINDRHRNDPKFRAGRIAYWRERDARVRERRDTDPEFAAAHRDRLREASARRRERVRNGEIARNSHSLAQSPRRCVIGMLPAAQLADAVVRMAARTSDGDLVAYCATIEVADRNVRAWRGQRAEVTFDVADRVLTRMGLLWFDVWHPGTPEGDIAEAAFEGESAVAA